MVVSAHHLVRTTMSGRVSEMTNISLIKQGLTTALGPDPSDPTNPSGWGPRPDLPSVRYVGNLRAVFRLIAQNVTSGHLTPLDDIATIHFARWVILPGDQQLLFTSNFDGSYEQYIHDFVTVANSGAPSRDNAQGVKWMDLIWGHCVGYPGTDDFPAFLDYIQQGLVETTLWFPTIDDVTVRDTAWLQEFRSLFVAFDQAFQATPRSSVPASLLAAYDALKLGINRIDVRDV
jgi:hypothetical protein